MEINCSIQLPLTFNCWKHHAGFIKKQIEFYRDEKISVRELQKTLLVIGESQMDLYVGELSPQKICDEIVSKLKSTGVHALEAYKKECIRLGCNQEHIDSIGLLIGRVCNFQANMESKVPDTLGDEIDHWLKGVSV